MNDGERNGWSTSGGAVCFALLGVVEKTRRIARVARVHNVLRIQIEKIIAAGVILLESD